MLRLTRKIEGPTEVSATLTLPLEQRIRSRCRVRLDDGREVGVFLERGTLLRDGDLLANDDGLTVQVRAAAEPLSSARASNPLLLARACYHLGNRHVPLQIAAEWVRFQPDPVLDEMLRRLGLEVSSERAPFDPEPGAYGGQAHGHGHDDSHGHRHEH